MWIMMLMVAIQVAVEWTPKNWVILGILTSGILSVLALLFSAKVFSMTFTTFVNALNKALIEHKTIQLTLTKFVNDCIEKHDRNDEAHIRIQRTRMDAYMKDLNEKLAAHDNSRFAHSEALKPYATTDMLNGLGKSIRYAIRDLRKDVHRLDPKEFENDEIFDDDDFDNTGGRK